MKYHELTTNKTKANNRVGRGIASGQGKTAGRGTKGQMSRTGSSKRPGFEGGQNPLMQRLPKLPGFRSAKPKAETIYTAQLNRLTAKTVTTQTLADAKLITSPFVRVKLLNKGEVSKALNVSLQAASQTAIEAVQKAGGTFEKAAQVARPASVRSKKT